MNKFPLLILCAGFGKRMLNLTRYTPKPLLKYKNQILLGNTINFFRDIGCNEIFINTHYLSKKIEIYIKENFNNLPIKLIHESSILGTGGGVKNIFNHTTNKNICVVNSDIFWQSKNKSDILDFLQDFNDVTHCKILLSKKKNFFGLKKSNGDFNLNNGIISNWKKGNEILFFSGLQIVSNRIFRNLDNNFPMNDVWSKLIIKKKLKGQLINSNIWHIGDKNSLELF